MASRPEIQKKIHEEIDDVLGKDGKLKWSERAKLPLSYAATMEGLRWRTITPLGAVRKVNQDTKIGEFDIPKGTEVLPNIYALHNDTKYWEHPEVYKPDRFLHKDGTLNMHRVDSYAPFSLGRRNCPGELVAMMEIFRYFVAIMQKFEICPVENSPLLQDGRFMATFRPIPQKLRYIPRG